MARCTNLPLHLWPWAAVLAIHFVSFPVPATADPFVMTIPADAAAPTEFLLRDSRAKASHRSYWDYLADMDEMRKRDTTATSTSSSASTSASSSTTSSATAVTTSTSTTSSTTSSSTSALPNPFDNGLSSLLSNNDNCSSFFTDFLANDTFKACYPFSMLLEGSSSFFEAEKSLFSITRVLDASCSANATTCAAYLGELRTNMTSAVNCQSEYETGNAIVSKAYTSLLAYETLYAASCLQNPDTDLYCFAEAITNKTNTASAYLYYLPLNISLPSTSSPTCNWCLQQTMAVYRSASANRSLSIASTYLSAADRIDTVCGSGYVEDSLPEALSVTTSMATSLHGQPWLVSLFVLTAYLLL